MPGNVTIKFGGTKAVLASMAQFPKDINRRKEVLDPGLVAGAVLFRDAAKSLVAVRSGVVRRNIIVQRWPNAAGGMAATVVVRVRHLKGSQVSRLVARNKLKGVSRYKGDPYYWRFLEFGTSKMAARPFLRPAFDTQKESAVSKAISEFRTRVQVVVEKLGKRTTLDSANIYLNSLGKRR